MNANIVNTVHMLLGPLALYSGFQLQQGNKMPKQMNNILMAAGAGLFAYHGFRAFQRFQAGTRLIQSYALQGNAFHLLFLAPLFLTTGYQLSQKKPVSNIAKFALLALGGAAVAYHGSQLINLKRFSFV